MYEIIFSEKFEEVFEKLDVLLRKRILKVLERVRFRPFSYFKKLVGKDAYKLRVGDYRVIADIKGNKLVILLLKVGHRKNIYKNL